MVANCKNDNNNNNVQVLGSKGSPFVMRVLIALNEKGIDYEWIDEPDVHNNKSQLLLQYNPVYKKVPVLIHNGRPVCESLIIVQYIEETWPNVNGRSLLPQDPYARYLVRFWVDYVERVMYPIGHSILTLPDGDAREKAIQDHIDCWIKFEGVHSELSLGQPYFGGANIGLLDIVLAPSINWFTVFETGLDNVILPGKTQCPNIHNWMRSMKENPSVKDVINHKSIADLIAMANMIREKNLMQAKKM